MPITDLLAQPLAPKTGTTSPITAISQGFLQGRQLAQQEEQFDQQGRLTDLKIQQTMQAIESAGETEHMKTYAKDLATANEFFRAGLPEAGIQVLMQRVERIQARDGDPSHTLGLINQFFTSPQDFDKSLRAELVGLKAHGFDVLDSGTKFEQGRGVMEGYVFNPDTGGFAIDPDIKRQIDDDAAKLKEEEGLLDPNQVAGVNDKVTSLTKDVSDAVEAANSLEALKGRGTPAAKIGAIFKFMKSLDPTSTVRESEGRMILTAEGAMKGFAQQVNQLLGEGPLSETNFADLVETSKVIANSAIKSAQSAVDSYLAVLDDKLTPEDLGQLKSRVPQAFHVSGSDPRLQEGDELEEGTIIEVPLSGGRTKKQILRNGEWVDI